MEALCQPSVPGENQTLKCPVCGRESSNEFCSYHLAAKEKIESAYPRWVKAYGRIEWKEYLGRVNRNVQTGQWAKEIAEYLEGV